MVSASFALSTISPAPDFRTVPSNRPFPKLPITHLTARERLVNPGKFRSGSGPAVVVENHSNKSKLPGMPVVMSNAVAFRSVDVKSVTRSGHRVSVVAAAEIDGLRPRSDPATCRKQGHEFGRE